MNADDETPSLGACCVCERTDGVINVIMLPYRGPTPGKGWGCVVCDLPADGASAVLCDDCVDKPLKFICTGYPAEDGRTALDAFELEHFDHDNSKHPEMISDDAGLPDSFAEPSYNLIDAVRLPLLFHSGGEWDETKRAEWLRITGTTEATTKVMCDHLRAALSVYEDQAQSGAFI